MVVVIIVDYCGDYCWVGSNLKAIPTYLIHLKTVIKVILSCYSTKVDKYILANYMEINKMPEKVVIVWMEVNGATEYRISQLKKSYLALKTIDTCSANGTA
jgi:hypothetical protein